jgi:insulysin
LCWRAAELAGLTYDLKVLPRGIRLTFGGYNDKLQEFATYVSRKLSSPSGIRDILPAKDSDFDRYKDQILRALSAFDAQQPYSHASYYAQLTLQPLKFQYPNSELRDATRKITLPDLVEYAAALFQTGLRGEALVQGNFDADEALDLVKAVGDYVLPVRKDPVAKDQLPPRLKALPLPAGDAKTLPTRLLIAEPNPSNENACSYAVLQSLGESPKDHVLIELLGAILSEPFYNELRTQKQLGYVVSSGVRAVGESRTLAFVVQSSVAEADDLTINVLAFLESARGMILGKLSKADFAVYVKSLIDRKTEPDKDLVSHVTRNWGEVSSGRLRFDRPQLEASALLELSRDDLLKFWDSLYAGNGRRVLICEMIPRVGPARSALPPSSFGYKLLDLADESMTLGLDDIEMFRRDREQLVDAYIERQT